MTDTPANRARNAFVKHFGREPDSIYSAPGRVNLIGEHTDYNDGFVLPCALSLGTAIAAGARPDNTVRAVAADWNDAHDEFALQLPFTKRADARWSDYVRGMMCVLMSRGVRLRGADLAIAGDVPQGAGLSSSASLEVAIGRAMLALAGDTQVTPPELARLAQSAENDFVGCKCGIMDQLCAAEGRARQAMLIDCRDLSIVFTPIPDDIAVLIVHSGVERGLVDGAYNERRAQCEAASRALGAPALRDADEAMLQAASARMDETTYRRARHVITENARTLAAAAALKASDLKTMGVLMAQSHASMRDDFEITVPPVDALVASLQSAIGPEGGARMTGGGFGGAVVALLKRSECARVEAAVRAAYHPPKDDLLMLRA